jgi:hypothetical protein
VHVLGVEEVAVAPPHLVEDVLPLVLRDPIHHDPGRRDLLRVLRRRNGVVERIRALGRDEDLLSILRDREAPRVFGQSRLLALLQIVDLELGLTLGGTPVEAGIALDVDEISLRHRERVVVVSLERGARNAVGKAVEVDLGRGLRLLLVFLLALFVFFLVFVLGVFLLVFFVFLVVVLDLVGERNERTGYVLAKRQSEDPRHAVGREVVFDRGNLRGEVALGEIPKVLAFRVPGRIVLAEESFGDLPRLPVFDGEHVEALLPFFCESENASHRPHGDHVESVTWKLRSFATSTCLPSATSITKIRPSLSE